MTDNEKYLLYGDQLHTHTHTFETSFTNNIYYNPCDTLVFIVFHLIH
jgi:hypothetical protein